MNKYRIIFILLVLILQGCDRNNRENKIPGIWIFDREISVNRLSKHGTHHISEYPIIYEFQKNHNLIKTNLLTDSIFSSEWKIIKDSKLSLENTEFIIHGLHEDSISLLKVTNKDSSILIYRKPKKNNINMTKNTISNILTSNIWAVVDSIRYPWAKHTELEYLINGKLIYHLKLFDNKHKTESEKLIYENWHVEKYDNFYFLISNYENQPTVTNWGSVNQLTSIDSNSYSIIENNNGYSREMKFTIRNNEEYGANQANTQKDQDLH